MISPMQKIYFCQLAISSFGELLRSKIFYGGNIGYLDGWELIPPMSLSSHRSAAKKARLGIYYGLLLVEVQILLW